MNDCFLISIHCDSHSPSFPYSYFPFKFFVPSSLVFHWLVFVKMSPILLFLSFGILITQLTAKSFSPYHAIHVVDNTTNRGVPLVTLKTMNDVEYVTDSQGYIAFHEEYLMDKTVWFYISSPGYSHDSVWGMVGKQIVAKPGATSTIFVKRHNLAVRLYRSTGAGIYRDSVKLGLAVPIEKPLINAGVLGLDSTGGVIYKDKYFWIWGDTNTASFPLGNFHVSGATSEIRDIDVDQGINFKFFEKDGFVKPLTNIAPNNVPTWIHSLSVVQDQMFAWYIKPKDHKNLMDIYGTVKWNDEKSEFELVRTTGKDHHIRPTGSQTFTHTEDGKLYLYFAQPFPNVRVHLARPDSYHDFANYEAFTCLVPNTRLEDEKVHRDNEGNVVYGWKKNTSPLIVDDYEKFVKSGKLKFSEAWSLQIKEHNTTRHVLAHRGSVNYNVHRKKYIMIFVESRGNPGVLGEIWFTESVKPEGPYSIAQKIATHDRVNLYNPVHHPFFDKKDGQIIYFEGTYTATFDIGPKVPYYNYNQLFYRLDLGDLAI